MGNLNLYELIESELDDLPFYWEKEYAGQDDDRFPEYEVDTDLAAEAVEDFDLDYSIKATHRKTSRADLGTINVRWVLWDKKWNYE